MKINKLKFNLFGQEIENSNAGFTLVEMVVTVLVFSTLVVTVVAIFGQAVRVERQAVMAQRIQENAMFILESMAKEIRVSSIINQDSPCNATTLAMFHPLYGNVTYSLTGEGNIQRQDSITSIINTSVTQFTRFNFCITGSGVNDNKTAKVTILMSIRNRTGAYLVTANLQTTVVSRDVVTEFQNP